MTPKCGVAKKAHRGSCGSAGALPMMPRRGVGSFPWLVRLLQTAYPVGIHFVEWSPSAACRGQAGCIRDDGHGGRSSDSRRPSPSAALPRPREIPQHGAPRAAGCHEMRRRATAPSASSRMWEAAIHNPFSLPSGGTPRGGGLRETGCSPGLSGHHPRHGRLRRSGFPAVQTRRLRRRRPNIPRMAAANPGMVPASAGRGAAPRDSEVVP